MASDLAATGRGSNGDRDEGVTHAARDGLLAARPSEAWRLSPNTAAYRLLPDNELRGAFHCRHRSHLLDPLTPGDSRDAPRHLPNPQGETREAAKPCPRPTPREREAARPPRPNSCA